jgi:hypothetical protein
MIVCLRTVTVPTEWRERYLAWINEGRRVIATTERSALTASDVHGAVDYRPIMRDEISAGYLNVPGLAAHDPSSSY